VPRASSRLHCRCVDPINTLPEFFAECRLISLTALFALPLLPLSGSAMAQGVLAPSTRAHMHRRKEQSTGRNSPQEGVAGREDVAPLSLKYNVFLFFIEHSSAHAQPSSMLSCHSFTPCPQTTQNTQTHNTQIIISQSPSDDRIAFTPPPPPPPPLGAKSMSS
jgi:hypothetical protein